MKSIKCIGLSMAMAALACSAHAADPSSIMGKWIMPLPNGKGMVTEFSPGSIVSYPVDETGKPSGPPDKRVVTYKDLGGESVAISFSDGGPGIMVLPQGKDNLTMDFPGLAAFKLVRLKEAGSNQRPAP